MGQYRLFCYTARMQSARAGFTLVEMLITVAIIAIVATAAVFAINPAELFKQSRDAKRLSELKLLNNAITVARVANSGLSIGNANIIYVSLADTTSTCANLGLAAPPVGWSYQCVTSAANLRNINGTGWIPIDLTSVPQGAPVDQLPLDPSNVVSSRRYYTYLVSGRKWKLSAVMESSKYASEMQSDGGVSATSYETGTDLTVAAP